MQQHERIKTEKCFECGRQAKHWHHVVPKCLGGHRCVPLCHECHEKVHAPESAISMRSLQHHNYVPYRATIPMFLDALRLRALRLSLRNAAEMLSIRYGLVINRTMVKTMWDGNSPIERYYVKTKSLLGSSTLIPTFSVDIRKANFRRAPRLFAPVLPHLSLKLRAVTPSFSTT